MLYKIKLWLIRLLTVAILFYVLWVVISKVSPAINPPEQSATSIERDYRGAIKFDIKQPF